LKLLRGVLMIKNLLFDVSCFLAERREKKTRNFCFVQSHELNMHYFGF